MNLTLCFAFARNESEFIKKVIDDILEKLPKVVPSNNKIQLVGVESRIEETESLLGAAPLLGIWGIGGISKTTIISMIIPINLNRNKSNILAYLSPKKYLKHLIYFLFEPTSFSKS